ncbi:hypothetical protein ACFL5V_00455 [Fibrobacterota bacterium]
MFRGIVLFIILLAVLSLFNGCPSGVGDWEPWEGEKNTYNIQFAEDTKAIMTWCRVYGLKRERTIRLDAGDEYERHGFEYFFYEADYGPDSNFRFITSLKLPEEQKLEIVINREHIICITFPENGARIVWIDRISGDIAKEVNNIKYGEYKFNEFLESEPDYNHGLQFCGGGVDATPYLSEYDRLVTSVRSWINPGYYLIDVGVEYRYIGGTKLDFNISNEYSPSPFILLDEKGEAFTHINPDTIFNIENISWVEMWNENNKEYGIYISDSNELILVDSVTEYKRLSLDSMVEIGNPATFIKYDTREDLEIINCGGGEYIVPISALGDSVFGKPHDLMHYPIPDPVEIIAILKLNKSGPKYGIAWGQNPYDKYYIYNDELKQGFEYAPYQ